MTAMRALEREDLPAVVRMFNAYLAWPHVADHDELVAAFARIFLDGPSVDDEIPSLVYCGRDGSVLGFIGSLVRRMRFDDQYARMACSSSLVVEPEARSIGVGAMLMRRYLAGPQDLTITDTATRDSERLWSALGGSTEPLLSITWLHALRPAAMVFDVGLPRLRRERWLSLAHRIAWPIDRPLTRRRRRRRTATPAALDDQPLTAEAVVRHTAAVDHTVRLRPDYDPESVSWLLDEMRRARSKGVLQAGLVSDAAGEVGWYVCQALPTDIWQIVHLGPWPGRAQALVDHVIESARTSGASGVRGRVTPAVFTALPVRTAMYSTVRFLYHTRRPEVARAVRSGDALITGLDGDMWLPT